MAIASTDLCNCGHVQGVHDATTQICRYQKSSPSCGCPGFSVPGNMGDLVADAAPLNGTDGDL